MFNKIKDKLIEREMNKLFEFLEKADYTKLKHEMLRTKWEALRAGDNNTYDLAETMYNVFDEFEKFYAKGIN